MDNLFSYEKLNTLGEYELNEYVKLIANLGSVYVKKSDILKINEEDVLILDTKVGDMLEVTSNDKNKFRGIMCISNNKNAIFVRQVY